jgi:23S rRNA (uracil1939-C5)-methyltransferase/tRNA (uracil-5-)-methyltransferase
MLTPFRPVSKGKKFNDRPFAYHQELELEIATLTNLGSGLGRVVLPESPAPGWVVMVPFALPGERVRVRVFRNHRNYSEADLVAVLTPSPHRVAAPCPLYGRCGGCQYQHLAYPEQLAWKHRQVSELLEHLGGTTFPVDPVVGSPREFGYRSKITPHFNPPREPEFPIGFLRQGTRFDIVDVPRCAIATDGINAALGPARARAREEGAAGGHPRGATLLFRDAGGAIATDGGAPITEEVAVAPPLRLRFLARDFFQNNPFILPAFVTHVTNEAAAAGGRFLIDAYCGSGLFALAAARSFERVAGVEISESSVAFARANAEANGLANAAFFSGEAGTIFAGLDFAPADTVVVIDPPRRGCDESFLGQLFTFGPRAVVYVSCDPATQMRDLRHFLSAGYRLVRVRPFDLFPQTRHLECVMTLARTAAVVEAP